MYFTKSEGEEAVPPYLIALKKEEAQGERNRDTRREETSAYKILVVSRDKTSISE